MLEQVQQVVFRIELVGFTGFDDAVHCSTGFGPFRTAAKQPILTADGKWSDAVFRNVILICVVLHSWILIVPQTVAQLLQLFFDFFNRRQTVAQFLRKYLCNLVFPLCHTGRILISGQRIR